MPDTNQLRRSMLFVPGSEPQRISKAQGLRADCLILDLEDAVATEAKVSARQTVCDAISNWPQACGAEVVVRINASDTPYFEDDLGAVLQAGCNAIMLPKSETAEQVASVAQRVQQSNASLFALVETALGVINASQIAQSASNILALCFGHVDFARDMGVDSMDATQGAVYHARAQIALAARAAGIDAIDNVSLAIRDEQDFEDDAQAGALLGYRGKLCIHPSQIKTANWVFSPSEDQIVWAQKVIKAWALAQKKGLGVFSLDNKMIDAPVIAAQENVLARAELAGLLDD